MELNLGFDRIVRLGHLVILIAFGSLFAWLTFAPLHGAVVARGLVKVESHRKTVQHNEGGIIEKILVRDGQHVEQGEALIELDTNQTAATYGIFRSALDAELARMARLEAEALLATQLRFPPELLARETSPVVSEMMGREKKLFQTRLQMLHSQTSSLEKQIDLLDQQLGALTGQHEAEQGAENLAKEELESYKALREKNFISTPRLLEQKRKVLDYLSRSEERRAELAQAKRTREEIRLKIINLRSQYTQEASQELKDATQRIAELNDRLRPAADQLARSTIRSPATGTVMALRANTSGASIAPRDPLLDIVPDSSNLVIETQVGVDEIKQLFVGQTSDIRFSALPYRSTPLITGKVSYIAADAQVSKEGTPYYLIHILPDKLSQKEAKIPALQPGMAAEIYIRTEARTALEYFMKPITETLARSFVER